MLVFILFWLPHVYLNAVVSQDFIVHPQNIYEHLQPPKKIEIKLPSIEDRCQTDLDF